MSNKEVIIGSKHDQFGDGKGKIIFNSDTGQDFTLPAGEVSAFDQITSADTTGNYIVYTKLRSTSLTLKVWGKGFNHIGTVGFQIIEDISGVISPSPPTNPTPENDIVGLPPNTDLG